MQGRFLGAFDLVGILDRNKRLEIIGVLFDDLDDLFVFCDHRVQGLEDLRYDTFTVGTQDIFGSRFFECFCIDTQCFELGFEGIEF